MEKRMHEDLTAWRKLVQEAPLEPERRIIDAHHHLWDVPPVPEYESYGEAEITADQKSGHNIVGSIYSEAQSFYRTSGPEHLRLVGETEKMNEIAERAAQNSGPGSGLCMGIVARADLLMGAAVDEVLHAHREAAPERLVGVRHRTPYDPVVTGHTGPRPGILAEPTFREGFARLAPAGLTFDVMVFHSQHDELDDLCRDFPDTTIVIDHIGCPIGIGHYASRPDEVFEQWSRSMKRLAGYGNVFVKLGGLNTAYMGLSPMDRTKPPTSDEVVALQRKHIMTCIDHFGPGRCMFESNFPVDMLNVSYGVVWNAFKKMSKDFSEDEKDMMFYGTAMKVYNLAQPQREDRLNIGIGGQS